MQKADYLLRLMKQRTDALLATDEKLQQFLMWVNEKSCSVEVPYRPSAVRAFYFAVAVARDMAGTRNRALSGSRDLARSLNLNIDHTPSFDIIVDLKLGRIVARAHALTHTFDDTSVSNFYRPFGYILNIRKLDLEFKQALEQIETQIPDPDDEERFNKWWQTNSPAWTDKLRAVMIKHRNIGHDWQFSYQQIQVLKQYYDANKLVVDCLNSDCNVTTEVRNEIEETLLLPTEMLPNAEG
ncbi:hypothetical protein NDI39_19965 [Microcoleus sp. ZQ-A2]|nr:hypothetical protein [Microcoleus sp. FACHB-1]